MTNQSDAQIGIQFSLVHLAERDNIDLIERGNQCLDNPVNTRDFVRQAQVRSSRNPRRDQAGGQDAAPPRSRKYCSIEVGSILAPVRRREQQGVTNQMVSRRCGRDAWAGPNHRRAGAGAAESRRDGKSAVAERPERQKSLIWQAAVKLTE